MTWLGEVIAYGAPVLVVSALARASWVAVRRVARSGPMRACRCGYALHGLPEPVCPECGARHEDTARARAAGRRRLAVLVWSAACGISGAAGFLTAAVTAPIRSERSGYVLFTYPSFGGARCDLHIEWHAAGPTHEEKVMRVVVSYARGRRQEELRYSGPDAAGLEEDLRRLCDRLGTPYADHAETFPAEAAGVVRGIMASPTGRLASDLRSNSIGNGSSWQLVPEPKRAGMLVVLGAVWAAGLWGLWGLGGLGGLPRRR